MTFVLSRASFGSHTTDAYLIRKRKKNFMNTIFFFDQTFSLVTFMPENLPGITTLSLPVAV